MSLLVVCTFSMYCCCYCLLICMVALLLVFLCGSVLFFYVWLFRIFIYSYGQSLWFLPLIYLVPAYEILLVIRNFAPSSQFCSTFRNFGPSFQFCSPSQFCSTFRLLLHFPKFGYSTFWKDGANF